MGIRDSTESFRSSLAFFLRRRFWHLLRRKILRLLKRKLLLGWKSEVVLDVNKTFGDIYDHDGSSLTEDLLDIAEHIITRDKTQQWASNLRFLTVSSPTLYKSGSGTRNCRCDAWEPFSENLTTQLRLTAYGEVKDCSHYVAVSYCWPQPRPEPKTSTIGMLAAISSYDTFTFICALYLSCAGALSNIIGLLMLFLLLSTVIASVRATMFGDYVRHRRVLQLSIAIGAILAATQRHWYLVIAGVFAEDSLMRMPVPKGLADHPYPILTSKGIRRGRAPKDIVDRAIRFAAHKGLSFIWIDQECIEQDDRTDKELGIQSMDLVYSRSDFPVGLLNTQLGIQQEVDALDQAIGRRHREGPEKGYGMRSDLLIESQEPVTLAELQHLNEALRKLSADRWLSRAWILQETLLAGNLITLLIRCSQECTKPQRFGDILGEAQLKITDVQGLDNSMKQIYPELRTQIVSNIIDGEEVLNRLLQTAGTVTPKLARGWMSYSGRCRSLNAITPVNFMEFYSNSRVSDRLAIIANLCDYRFRLDTNILDDLGASFSTCLLALTLLNGDISLLVYWHEVSAGIEFKNMPWYRKVLPLTGQLTNESKTWSTFSWAPSPLAGILSIDKYKYDDDTTKKFIVFNEPPVRLYESRLGQNGLVIQAWVWHIEDYVNLMCMTDEFNESWTSHQEKSEKLEAWEHRVLFVWRLFQTLLSEGREDVAELLWRQAVVRHGNSWFDHRNVVSSSYCGSGHKVGNTQKNWLEPHLKSLFDPETLEYVGQSCPWKIEIVDFCALLRMGLRDVAEWGWLIPQIMRNGYLALGHIENSIDGTPLGCCIFEGISEGNVMTPRLAYPVPEELPMWLLGFRARPVSWHVERRPPTRPRHAQLIEWRGKGMVRGLWRVGQATAGLHALS